MRFRDCYVAAKGVVHTGHALAFKSIMVQNGTECRNFGYFFKVELLLNLTLDARY